MRRRRKGGMSAGYSWVWDLNEAQWLHHWKRPRWKFKRHTLLTLKLLSGCLQEDRHDNKEVWWSEREGKYSNNPFTLALPLCQGHPALCDLVCLGLYVSLFFFFACRAPLSIRSPSLLSLSLFFSPPCSLSPRGWHTTQIAQYCQIKSRCPLSHFNTAPVGDPPIPTEHAAMVLWELRGWKSTYCTTEAMKRHVWIFGVIWEGMRRDCHRPVSTKSIILLINADTREARRGFGRSKC